MDLIGFVAQALDGTKIQSVCTSRGGHGKDGLDAMLAKVEKHLEELERQLEQSANTSECTEQESLPEALTHARTLREKVRDNDPYHNSCFNYDSERDVVICPQGKELYRLKMQRPESKSAYKQRTGIVEPLFAWIKINDRFTRWTVKGLTNVQAQWLWLCAAQNLRKLMQVWGEMQKKSLSFGT